MQRTASAYWQGGLKNGNGTLSTQSGVLSSTQYSFSTRFENGIGTNPEELIAAAHAGCFTMDLSSRLEHADLKPQELRTTATLTMDKTAEGFTITGIHLDIVAKIDGASVEAFNEAVAKAKEGCPVSRVLIADITVSATLEQ